VIHIVLDILGVYGSFLLAYGIRVGWIFSTDFSFESFALVSALSAFFWIGFLIVSRYYRIPPRSETKVLYDIIFPFLGGTIGVGLMIVTYFFQSELFFSRLINVYSIFFGVSFLFFSQFIFRFVIASHKKQNKNIYRTLIIGANRVAQKLIHAIDKNPYAPYRVVGVIDPYGLTKSLPQTVILGKLNTLEPVCKKEKITAIIQCDAFEHTINLISFCDEKNIKFQFDPALRGIFEENLRIREVAGQTMISFVQRNFTGTKKIRYRFIDWILQHVFDLD
jgi:FlaA1/EpsC-like NDP-sugar epimerase